MSISPPGFSISGRDWWVKVLGMLQHNWALVAVHPDGTATAYFFHDRGVTQGGGPERPGWTLASTRGRSAVVDALDFPSEAAALRGLRRNGFVCAAGEDGPWAGEEPGGSFYDARASEPGVYSRRGHWR